MALITVTDLKSSAFLTLPGEKKCLEKKRKEGFLKKEFLPQHQYRSE